MATTLEDFGIDLFGSDDLSLGELKKLDTLVNCSEISKIAFYGHFVKMRNSGPVHALFHPLD